MTTTKITGLTGLNVAALPGRYQDRTRKMIRHTR